MTARCHAVTPLRWRIAAIAVALAVTAGACSSGGSDNASGPKTGRSTTTSGTPAPRTCKQGATVPEVQSEPVNEPDRPADYTITSFDGTKIRAHWFPVEGASADRPVPTILKGPGWSSPGDISDVEDGGIFAAITIKGLHEAGYNVLTWDPRGFGKSTGTVELNSAAAEGRDVQVLLDWVAQQPQARTDAEGDPRVGMVGFSYGGGIQLILASIDCRVDALVPGIAWHSLETSLYKNETMKVGWSNLLLAAASRASLDPHIQSAYDDGVATGTLSADDIAWFRDRGPADAMSQIDVPTLFLQGTVDTLFTLDEAIANYRALRQRDVPTAMVWFCGGHGVCLTESGNGSAGSDATLAWLDRYLNDDPSVDTGPRFSLVDQEGTTWTADDYPEKTDAEITANGSGTLRLTEGGGSGPATLPISNADLLAVGIATITPGAATNTVELPIETGQIDGVIVSAPKLTITYSGTTPDGAKPVRIFAQLVDNQRKVVVDNQITPIPLELDGSSHTATIDLEVVAQRVAPGQTLTLQLVATTVAYATGRLGGEVTFEAIKVTIPVETKRLTRG